MDRLPGTVRQGADFVRHDREATPLFAGAGRLDGGVQGKQVGLFGDVKDDLHHSAHFLALGAQVPHHLGVLEDDIVEFGHFVDGAPGQLAAHPGRLRGLVHRPGGFLGLLFHFLHRLLDFLHQVVDLGNFDGLFLRPLGDLLDGGGHVLAHGGDFGGGMGHALDLLGKVLGIFEYPQDHGPDPRDEGIEPLRHLPDFIPAPDPDLERQVGLSLGEFFQLGPHDGDRLEDEIKQGHPWDDGHQKEDRQGNRENREDRFADGFFLGRFHRRQGGFQLKTAHHVAVVVADGNDIAQEVPFRLAEDLGLAKGVLGNQLKLDPQVPQVGWKIFLELLLDDRLAF